MPKTNQSRRYSNPFHYEKLFYPFYVANRLRIYRQFTINQYRGTFTGIYY